MSMTLKIALITISLIYLLIILRAVKNKKLQLSFSLFWILTGVSLIIAILIPNFLDCIAKILGFDLTSNMLFCVTIFLAFLLIFNLTGKLSNESRKNTILVQEISILKKKVEKLEEKKEE